MIRFAHDGRIALSGSTRVSYGGNANRETADGTRQALQHPLLAEALIAIQTERFRDAQHVVARYIATQGRTTAAIMVLGAAFSRQNRAREASVLLREAVARVPHLTEAQVTLAAQLFALGAADEAVALLDAVTAHDPTNMAAARQRMWGLANTGNYTAARQACEKLLSQSPTDASLWLSYGNLLKAKSSGDAAVAAYRRALAIQPDWGEPWWSLANLKTDCLNARDIADMQQALGLPLSVPADQVPIHFALGRALQKIGQYEQSFRHLEQGNRLYRAGLGMPPPPVGREVEAAKDLTTPAFIAARSGMGLPAPDPIFIVGMPRSGTTLVEQILASHSGVEATAELPHISSLVHALIAEHEVRGPTAYADMLARLDPAKLVEIGQDYLQRAAGHRHSGKPLFVDKMPSNWRYIAFIRLILPQARIVDVRRNAVDCCFSNYEQLFGGGHEFAYSLSELGSHYRAYVSALDHARRWADGKLIDVSHSALVRDPETAIRQLLASLDLPFEQECLRFYESDRPVSTPSAQQVRQPINGKGIGRWRPYAQWLQPLINTLGDLAREDTDGHATDRVIGDSPSFEGGVS
jgi:tetratricopeptide (TPR) repeat protein